MKIHDYFYLVKLKGDYFEMGRQYGEQMRQVLKKDVAYWLKYMRQNQTYFLKKIPAEYKKADLFMSIMALYTLNSPFYNKNIIMFLKGVAETGQIEFHDLIYCNVFADLMDNHCTLLSKKLNGSMVNLRTLDFGAPQLCQSLIVFHPPDRIPYASLNVSFVAGIFTGVSQKGLFFGESYYDTRIGELAYQGMPFHHIAHNILSEASTLAEGEKLLSTCHRVSNLQLQLADNTSAKIYLASADKFVEQQTGDYVWSGANKALLVKGRYLHSVEAILKKFIPRNKSGELHCMMSYEGKLYVSVTSGLLQSFNNSFYAFDLGDLFKTKP
jgi:hypothetical protein